MEMNLSCYFILNKIIFISILGPEGIKITSKEKKKLDRKSVV